MRTPRIFSGALGAALTITTWAAVGRADDAVAAQALFDQGRRAMAAHNYAEACPKFEESLRVQPALGTLHNLAACYELQGKLATAWSKFLELADKAGAAGQNERARIGKKRAADLAPRLSNLLITVENAPSGLEVRRDGTLAGQAEWGTAIPADAGTHIIEAKAPGKQPWSTSVIVNEGAKTSTVTVPELVAVPQAPTPSTAAADPEATAALLSPSARPRAPFSDTAESSRGLGTQRILALVSAGVGLAGVGVGSYFGLQSLSKHNEAWTVCPNRSCDQNGLNLWNDAKTAGDRSTMAFIVGGAGLAGAALLWFTARKPERSAVSSAQLRLGVGTLQLTGVW